MASPLRNANEERHYNTSLAVPCFIESMLFFIWVIIITCPLPLWMKRKGVSDFYWLNPPMILHLPVRHAPRYLLKTTRGPIRSKAYYVALIFCKHTRSIKRDRSYISPSLPVSWCPTYLEKHPARWRIMLQPTGYNSLILNYIITLDISMSYYVMPTSLRWPAWQGYSVHVIPRWMCN